MIVSGLRLRKVTLPFCLNLRGSDLDIDIQSRHKEKTDLGKMRYRRKNSPE